MRTLDQQPGDIGLLLQREMRSPDLLLLGCVYLIIGGNTQTLWFDPKVVLPPPLTTSDGTVVMPGALIFIKRGGTEACIKSDDHAFRKYIESMVEDINRQGISAFLRSVGIGQSVS